eukprot:TRINITY_DN5470_c0_g1_i1.p1 TRINITY_DN5470_c0_g1~~TRINITY_DN5470_c0_g1_i1.p1  ORF type:complete len:372 (-),score=41.07 TRINITY_DN5470_c0_g1_i1:36-1151(-)
MKRKRSASDTETFSSKEPKVETCQDVCKNATDLPPHLDLASWWDWTTEDVLTYCSWVLRRPLQDNETEKIKAEKIIGRTLGTLTSAIPDLTQRDSDPLFLFMGLSSFGDRDRLGKHICRLVRFRDYQARNHEFSAYKTAIRQLAIAKAQVKLCNLPDKIWVRIFYFLLVGSPPSALSLELVCKKFKDILRENDYIWFNLCKAKFNCTATSMDVELDWRFHYKTATTTKYSSVADALAEYADLDLVKSMVNHGYCVETFSTRSRNTALVEALQTGAPFNFIVWLVDVGKADVNGRCGGYSTSPLGTACSIHASNIVQFLCERGAVVTIELIHTEHPKILAILEKYKPPELASSSFVESNFGAQYLTNWGNNF